MDGDNGEVTDDDEIFNNELNNWNQIRKHINNNNNNKIRDENEINIQNETSRGRGTGTGCG